MNQMNQNLNVVKSKSLYSASGSDEFDITLEDPETGIEYPAVLVVDSYFRQPPHKGSPLTCDNPNDYYGYTDLDYRILDQYGEESDALEALVTLEDQAEFEAMYEEYLEEIRNEF